MSGRTKPFSRAKVNTSMYDPNAHNFKLSAERNRKAADEEAKETREKTVATMLIYKGSETRRVNVDGTTEIPHPDAKVAEYKPNAKKPEIEPAPRWDWKAEGWSDTPPVVDEPKKEKSAKTETPKA